jgi:ribosomal protein S14
MTKRSRDLTSDLYYQDMTHRKKRKIGGDYWRNQALQEASEEGARRQRCEKCGEYFPHSYMRYVYLGSFKSGYVCQDCKKCNHLQSA